MLVPGLAHASVKALAYFVVFVSFVVFLFRGSAVDAGAGWSPRKARRTRKVIFGIGPARWAGAGLPDMLVSEPYQALTFRSRSRPGKVVCLESCWQLPEGRRHGCSFQVWRALVSTHSPFSCLSILSWFSCFEDLPSTQGLDGHHERHEGHERLFSVLAQHDGQVRGCLICSFRSHTKR